MKKEIKSERLTLAIDAVIEALKPFPPEYKIAALHTLIESFPAEYILWSEEKENKR